MSGHITRSPPFPIMNGISRNLRPPAALMQHPDRMRLMLLKSLSSWFLQYCCVTDKNKQESQISFSVQSDIVLPDMAVNLQHAQY